MIIDTYNAVANREEADRLSERIEMLGKKTKADNKDIIRLRFAVEEALLALDEKYNSELPITVQIEKKIEIYSVKISYIAEAYNPFSEAEQSGDEWSNQMLERIGQKPVYHQKGDFNVLQFAIPKKRYKQEMYILLAVVLAVLFGVFGKLIPEAVRMNIATYGLDLISDIFLRLLGVFSGLIIFFSLVNGICGMGSVGDFSKVGRNIIIRYVGLSFIGGAVLTVAASFLFRIQWGGAVNGGDIPNQIKEIILSIFPGNPIEPFEQGNMLQIIFLAVLIGVVLLGLGNRVRSVRVAVVQANDLITKSLDIICRILPIFIFTSLLSMFWQLGFGMILSLWKPLAITVLLGLVIPIAKLLYIALRYHLSPFVIIRRLFKSVFVSFTTASTMASYSAIRDNLIKGLGVEEKFVEFSFPIGMNLYAASYTLVYLNTILFLAEKSETPVSVIWIVMAGFFSVVFSIATPNVSGGALICVGVMMTNLNMPDSALALAGTLIIILDFYGTATRNLSHELEVFLQAKKFGKVDETVLQKDGIIVK